MSHQNDAYWTEIDLTKSKNQYFDHPMAPTDRAYPCPAQNYNNPFQQIKIDGTRDLRIEGNKVAQSDMEETFTQFVGDEEKATNVGNAYSQFLHAEMLYLIHYAISDIGITKKQALFRNFYRTQSGKIALATGFHSFEIGRDNSNDQPIYTIPGAVLYLYIYDEDRGQFRLKKPLVSNRLLADIFLLDTVPNLQTRAEKLLNTTWNTFQFKKSSKVSAEAQELLWKSQGWLSECMFDEKYPTLLEQMKRHEEFLLSHIAPDIKNNSDLPSKIEETFTKLKRTLIFLDRYDLFQKEAIDFNRLYQISIRKFNKAIIDLSMNIRSNESHFEAQLKAHLSETIVQTTQVVTNCIIDNLEKYQVPQTVDVNIVKVTTTLKQERDEFYKLPAQLAVRNPDDIKGFFDKKISQPLNDKQLNIPRKLWQPILCSVLVSLTGVGLILVAGKAIHGLITGKSPLLFDDHRTEVTESIQDTTASLTKMTCSATRSA